MTNFFSKPPHFLYEKFVKRQKEGVSFVIFLFFLIGFIISRAWVYLSIIGLVPASLTENVRGVHIHHFAWGILINSIVGYLVFVIPRADFHKWKLKLAALFGIGLALTFDEFGMWLRLQDDYLVRHGYDAIILISILFINIIYFGGLWQRLANVIYKDLKKLASKGATF